MEDGILYPNAPLPVNVTKKLIISNGNEEAPATVSHEQYLSLKRGDSYVATYMYLTYRDIFGIEHWQKYCYWQVYFTFADQADKIRAGIPVAAKMFTAQSCSEYNDADNNQPN